jgi:FkbM family methyltransferase
MGHDPFGTYPPTQFQSAVRAVGARLPRVWLGLRISGLLRHVLKATTRGPIDVTVLGQRMRLRLLDNACERRLMVTPQFFDPEELKLLRGAMRPDFQFIDVGANVGTYTVFVGKLVGRGSRILAIEPQAEALERLRENLQLNEIDAHIAPFAVGEAEGEVDFVVDSANLGFTSINLQRRGRGERHIVRLPVRRLIDLVREARFERIDAMKVDIEGAEDIALLPFFDEAPQALWPKLLIVENNRAEWRRDCVAYLEARGYRAREVSGNVILQRGETLRGTR